MGQDTYDIGEPSHPDLVAQLKKGRAVVMTIHDEDGVLSMDLAHALNLRDWLNRAISVMSGANPTPPDDLVGRSIERAWNQHQDLPPIELTPDERIYLAQAAIAAIRADVLEEVRAALDADAQTIRLHCGEMTAQEMRTVKAAFGWVKSLIPHPRRDR